MFYYMGSKNPIQPPTLFQKMNVKFPNASSALMRHTIPSADGIKPEGVTLCEDFATKLWSKISGAGYKKVNIFYSNSTRCKRTAEVVAKTLTVLGAIEVDISKLDILYKEITVELINEHTTENYFTIFISHQDIIGKYLGIDCWHEKQKIVHCSIITRDFTIPENLLTPN